MIDALDARALMGGVLLQHAFGSVHPRIEVERHAERVGGAQGAALVRQLRKRGRQIAAAEPECGAVEIFFAGELEAERAPAARGRRSTIEWWLRSSTPRR